MEESVVVEQCIGGEETAEGMAHECAVAGVGAELALDLRDEFGSQEVEELGSTAGGHVGRDLGRGEIERAAHSGGREALAGVVVPDADDHRAGSVQPCGFDGCSELGVRVGDVEDPIRIAVLVVVRREGDRDLVVATGGGGGRPRLTSRMNSSGLSAEAATVWVTGGEDDAGVSVAAASARVAPAVSAIAVGMPSSRRRSNLMSFSFIGCRWMPLDTAGGKPR